MRMEGYKDVLLDRGSSVDRGGHNEKSQRIIRTHTGDINKVYGNIGDIVNHEEKTIYEMLREKNSSSPFGPAQNANQSRIGRPNTKSQGRDQRLKGMESIYMQKFEQNKGKGKKQPKAKFR